MDSPLSTLTTHFRTPPRILIPKLVRSRDQWKAKATARKRLFRKEKIRSRDLAHSRQFWKDRARDAELKLQQLHEQLQHTQAELAEARSQIATLQVDSKKN
jgi:predicted  nucleic acid-binding Zn-ribbon protein